MELIVKHFDELSTKELYEILKTRAEIFVVEQDCVYQDLDDKDQDAIHVFCWNDKGRVAGSLRVFMKDEENKVAQIGRVVTLEHGKGLGRKLLKKGVEVAERSFDADRIYLEAQKYAIGYYAKEGFEVTSDEFLEDGIPHVQMERRRRVDIEAAVARITAMEEILDEALRRMDAAGERPQDLLDYQYEVKELSEYYTGPDWKADFALDEDGLLPKDLKRGVLSEDGIYDALERNKELLERIR
ncbi:GNAT family N-acetyltransferase [Butyrivibrio sp. FCS006]|uniref:GNAT family N-acetyltransferase n=1 Tax=Butyrivibrio sp. FCS006 TaxID=1280684 RepID=UPI0004257CE8|nr:GNAT family N-acetyltransferase [Butyrivibrio sp. FCS006]